MGKIETATQWLIDIANDDTHGYSQTNRWGPDYDCSSAVISAWEYAGVPVKTQGAGSTQTMLTPFLNCGFTDVTSQINLSTGSGLQRGDGLLNVAEHTMMAIGNGQIVGARSDRGYPATGDQLGTEICTGSYYNHPWNYVLRYTGDDSSSSGSGTGGTTTYPTLSSGSTGSAVKLMQQKLMMLHYDCGSAGADGDFGSGTLAAVKKFQQENGLTVDGVCGSNTHAKLDSKYNALGVFTAICNLANLKVRTGDSTDYDIFTAYPKLNKGEEVLVAETTANNWYFAFVGDQYVAYMAANYMKKA